MTSKTEPFSPKNVVLQSWLRPALTAVGPNLDHRRMVAELERIEGVLGSAHMEDQAMDMAVERLGENASAKDMARAAEFAVFSLRAEVLRHLRGLLSFQLL